MKLNKQMLAAIAVTTVATGGIMGISATSAHFGGSAEDRAAQVTEFAERFNLEESEVESYFEEKREERQAERQAERAEHLASLVENGTLTQAQADELNTMQEANRTEVDSLRDSGAEREDIKTLMDENKAELESWAESQGLSLDDIKPERGEHQRQRGPRL